MIIPDPMIIMARLGRAIIGSVFLLIQSTVISGVTLRLCVRADRTYALIERGTIACVAFSLDRYGHFSTYGRGRKSNFGEFLIVN
jgi:hypothetical protein